MAPELIAAVSPVARRVRAFFAPVNRSAAQATIWDPAGIAGFNPCPPPAPWIDLGWCEHFTRKSNTRIAPLITGAPGIATAQVRTEVDATVSLEFASWGKLQMALASGVQQMNVLATQTGAVANGSGGAAIAAVPLTAGSTATMLNVGTARRSGVLGGSGGRGRYRLCRRHRLRWQRRERRLCQEPRRDRRGTWTTCGASR